MVGGEQLALLALSGVGVERIAVDQHHGLVAAVILLLCMHHLLPLHGVAHVGSCLASGSSASQSSPGC